MGKKWEQNITYLSSAELAKRVVKVKLGEMLENQQVKIRPQTRFRIMTNHLDYSIPNEVFGHMRIEKGQGRLSAHSVWSASSVSIYI